MTVRDQLTNGVIRFTRSDFKIVRALLDNYPTAGLRTVAELAGSAGVSNPTVIRFVTRLGFDNFLDFQNTLLSEVEDRMSSPLSMFEDRKQELQQQNLYQRFLAGVAEHVQTAADDAVSANYEAAIELLGDTRRNVYALGGRFSQAFSNILCTHLMQLRPRAHLLSATNSSLMDHLIDIGRRDVLVVYDYRRYQIESIEFARQAADQGCSIILFTDPWKSPIADVAGITFISSVSTISPFDTNAPALAQTEALIAGLTAHLGESSRNRFEKMEALRSRNPITEVRDDDPDHDPETGADR